MTPFIRLSAAALALLVGGGVAGSLAGCDDDADSQLEQEAKAAGDELEEAGKAVGKTLETAGEEAAEAAEEGKEELGEAMETAGENLQKDADPDKDKPDR